MQKLELRIQPNAWRVFYSRKQDPRFKSFSEKIFQRDDYVCQFCGFQAIEFQEIINLDQNYFNNKPSNLVTACCFCTQCFFLDAVGISYGGGTLIFLEEFGQVELNSLCHVLFCAITNETGYRETAQSIYRNLKLRSQPFESAFGEGISEPSAFAQLYLDTVTVEKINQAELFSNIRLLPSRARFRQQIEHWAKSAIGELA